MACQHVEYNNVCDRKGADMATGRASSLKVNGCDKKRRRRVSIACTDQEVMSWLASALILNNACDRKGADMATGHASSLKVNGCDKKRRRRVSIACTDQEVMSWLASALILNNACDRKGADMATGHASSLKVNGCDKKRRRRVSNACTDQEFMSWLASVLI